MRTTRRPTPRSLQSSGKVLLPLFLSFVAAGCSEPDEFHRILSSKLYADKSCKGAYFQISDSGWYALLGDGREFRMTEARLVKLSDTIGRIDRQVGELTLKIDVRVDHRTVFFSPPHFDPPFPRAFWKYKETTGQRTEKEFWGLIDSVTPPSITYSCGE